MSIAQDLDDDESRLALAMPEDIDIGETPDPRFTMANERTLLAWNRTGLALIVAGLAAAQLLDIASRGLVAVLAVGMVALGVGLSVASLGRWRRAERAMRLGEPLPASAIQRLLVLGIVLIGALAAVVVVVDAVQG